MLDLSLKLLSLFLLLFLLTKFCLLLLLWLKTEQLPLLADLLRLVNEVVLDLVFVLPVGLTIHIYHLEFFEVLFMHYSPNKVPQPEHG